MNEKNAVLKKSSVNPAAKTAASTTTLTSPTLITSDSALVDKLTKQLKYNKDKYDDLEQCYNEKGAFIVKLEEEIDSLKQENVTLKSDYKPEDKRQLLQVARDTIAVLGAQFGVDLEQLSMVILSDKYSTVKVKSLVYQNVVSMVDKMERSSSFIF